MAAIARTAPRDARLLAEIASPLTPQRPPFYITNSPIGAADGWYWVPAGAGAAQYLGRNVLWAERKLLELRGQP